MELAEYATMFEVEDSHWWYAGMRRISQTILDRQASGATYDVLDAGCGTGANLVFLSRYGSVCGIDIEPVALDFCRRRRLESLVQGSVCRLPYADASFDLVTSFEVLYHLSVNDDRAPLAEMWRVLRPGGLLLLRLPAHDWLRGRHDCVVHTRHRYTTAEVRHKVTAAGFTVVLLSYANCLLYPLALAKRLAERFQPRGDGSDVGQPPPYNGLLLSVLSAEAGWLARWPLPWGLSVLCLARRSG